MRSALLALMLIVTLGEAVESAVWHQGRLVVRDYTTPDWQPTVAAVVAEFNRVLPRGAPSLIYRAMPATPCEQTQKPWGGIVICSHPVSGFNEDTQVWAWHGTMRRAVIRVGLLAEFIGGKTVVCHGLMHAITDIRDNYTVDLNDTSCVWGSLDRPGAFDVKYARKVYKKKRR